MKISSRAKTRESKRINHFLIKFRDDIEENSLANYDKKSTFLGLRWKARRSHKIEDMRQRISSEYVNRTAREREALQFEVSANGLSF